MTQDANSEQGNVTQSEFDTSVHPEGARPFKDGSILPDLAREHPDGTLETNITIPDDVSAVDPQTREVEFDKVPLLPETSAKKRTKGVAAIAAGAVATAVIGGLGAVKLMGGGTEENPQDARPTTSASSSPNVEPKPDKASIDEINKRPSTEQLALAEAPVSSKEYPTVQDAYPALVDRLNTFAMGATIDIDATPPVETPESIASGERMLEAIYGPGYLDRPGMDPTNNWNIRRAVGLEFFFLYDSEGKEATFRVKADPTVIEPTNVAGAKEAYAVQSTVSTDTNILELDPGQTTLQLPSPTHQRETIVFLAQDGNWYVDHITDLSD